jgi:sugar transferase (PEP-CTERM/EpsH1 system associated)
MNSASAAREVQRPHLLFLCHRIPYPPDKGDKIRSYRWWLAFLDDFQVHLGTFVDDPADWAHVPGLRERCASSLFLSLPRRRATLRSLRGFLDGGALSVAYYRDRRMRGWVRDCAARFPIAHVFVYSSAMAQYADDPGLGQACHVIDFVDVDSDKWRQYADGRTGPAAWVYRREADRLARTEAHVAREFDASVFVSEDEARLFRNQAAVPAERVVAISNGVDASYFSPWTQTASPFSPDCEPVVFTGAMDYWANVDAVIWFVREVWPRVTRERPRALFHIVGARPTTAVEALRRADVQVTGRVPDIRPYLQHAALVVAPMRIARGIQNKVLEGMAMGKTVIVTGKGLEGINAVPDRDLLVADDPDAWATTVVAVLARPAEQIGANARRLVEAQYGWASAGQSLIELIRPTHLPRVAIPIKGEQWATAHLID